MASADVPQFEDLPPVLRDQTALLAAILDSIEKRPKAAALDIFPEIERAGFGFSQMMLALGMLFGGNYLKLADPDALAGDYTSLGWEIDHERA